MDSYKEKYYKYKNKYLYLKNLIGNGKESKDEPKSKKVEINPKLLVTTNSTQREYKPIKKKDPEIERKREEERMREVERITTNRILKKKEENAIFNKIIINNTTSYTSKDYLSILLDEIIKFESDKLEEGEVLEEGEGEEPNLININGILNIDFENIINLYIQRKINIYPFVLNIINLLTKKNFIINIICKNSNTLNSFITLLEQIIKNTSIKFNVISDKINNNLLNIYYFKLLDSNNDLYNKENSYDDAIFWIINLAYFIKLQKIEQIYKLHILTNDNLRINESNKICKYIFELKDPNFKIELNKCISDDKKNTFVFNIVTNYKAEDQLNKLFQKIAVYDCTFYDTYKYAIENFVKDNMSIFTPNLQNLLSIDTIKNKINYVNTSSFNFNIDQYYIDYDSLKNSLKNAINSPYRDQDKDKYKIGFRLLTYFKYLQLVYFSIYSFYSTWDYCNKNNNDKNIITNRYICTSNKQIEEIDNYFNNLLN